MTLHDSAGHHHLHRRKRIHEKHEPYPHPVKWKRYLDKLMYGITLIGPIMTIPQLWNIWIMQNAAGVSIISWSAYLLCATMWLVYGIAHKEKLIIFSNVVWVILDIFVILGIIIY